MFIEKGVWFDSHKRFKLKIILVSDTHNISECSFFLESLTENALGNNTGTAPGPWNGGFCLKIERLHQKQEQLQDLEVEYHQSNW